MSLVAYLGIASGVALVLTGLVLGLARPRRAGGWLFLAFVVVWGIETVLFNSLSFLEEISTILIVERLALAAVLAEVLFLVHFTVRFTRSMETHHRWWSWGAAAFTLTVGALLALEPSMFSQVSGRTDLAVVLITVPKFAVFYVTVGLLARRHGNARTQIEHREVRIVLLGLVLYAAYNAGFYLSLYIGLLATEPPELATQILAGLFAAATLFLAVLIVDRWRMEALPDHWRAWERPLFLGATTFPFLLGLGTGVAQIIDLPRIDLQGLVRLGTALVVTYGLLKFEIFDIDRKVKTGIKGSLIAGVFVVAFFVVSEGLEAVVSDAAGTWAGLGAAGLLTLGLRPLEHRASQLADRAMPGVDESEAYQEERSLEVYQAAVERAAADEVLTDREKQILTGLRDELGLRGSDAREIEQRVLATQITA